METDLSQIPFVIVDLYAGRWVMSKIGHECFNFEIEEDLDAVQRRIKHFTEYQDSKK